MNEIIKININEIDDFNNHPFKIEEGSELDDLVDSIKRNGLLIPIIVRKKEDNRYELLSGHRRKKVYEILGLKVIDAIIKNLNNDEATIYMVDSNMYREKILPSEKAFAYKMKMEAIKHQGKTSCHNGTKLRSDEILSQKSNDSARQIQRYIRLTYLIKELLDIVDNTVKLKDKHKLTMGLLPAVELSYLLKQEQQVVYSVITYQDVTPSHSQAIRIKKLSVKQMITFDEVEKILLEQKGNQHEQISFNKSKIMSVLPFNLATRDKRYIERYIIEAIILYKNTNQRKLSIALIKEDINL